MPNIEIRFILTEKEAGCGGISQSASRRNPGLLHDEGSHRFPNWQF
jgi:hypothetical protein